MDAITINADELRDVVHRGLRVCLDLWSGEFAAVHQCPEPEVGEGRGGVRAGRRFIAVPPLDEMVQEFTAQHNKLDDGRWFTPNVYRTEVPDATDDEARKAAEDAQRWLQFCNEEAAIERAAMNWLRCLALPMRIEWLEPHLGVVSVCEPGANEWSDTL